MPYVIDLEGLPEQVANAIVQTVANLKDSYKSVESEPRARKPKKPLPTFPVKIIGELRREDIYEDR